MPDFFSESPLNSILIGLLAMFVFGALWIVKQRGIFLGLAIASVAMTIGMVALERVIVTDNEQLNNHLTEMVVAVRSNDVDGLIRHVHTDQTELIHDIRNKMKQIEVSACTITSREKPVYEQVGGNTRARLTFVAFGSASESRGDHLGGSGFQGVVLYFEKDATAKWGVVAYELFNPRTGQ